MKATFPRIMKNRPVLVYLAARISIFLAIYNKSIVTIPGAQLGGREGGRIPLPFFENKKKCLDFAKKGPDCVHL